MKPESGKTLSVWAATADVPQFPQLSENLQADVCIVGAGIAGMTTAYLCVQQGKKVVVLDDNDIGGGATHRTTAHLSNAIDDRYFTLINHLGVDKARLAMESHSAAIDKIETIASEENIACDFLRVDGYLFCADEKQRKTLEQEMKALDKIGFAGAEELEQTPFGKSLPNQMRCIRFPRQGQFHVLKYLSGLAAAVTRMGGKIFTNTHVSDIADGHPATVTVENGSKVAADWICVTTNSPISDYAKIYVKEAAWRTYVVAAEIDAGYVNQALFWDLADPYHYIRTQPIAGSDKLLLIVGGEDHRTGQERQPEVHLSNLEMYVRQMFPAVQKLQFHWSGQVMETVDGLAYIGQDPERGDNILIATGDSGMGMTHGTIAGMLLSDQIQALPNRWSDLYNPKRSPLSAPRELAGEMIKTARAYSGYVTGADTSTVADIAPGHGGVVDHNGQKIAVFRDLTGQLHQKSAVCPHMKGILQWNSCEQTWDCGAHGSRFTAEGRVINGPAISDMQAVPEHNQIHEQREPEQPIPRQQTTDYGDQPPA